jgi:hypothetical protein
MDIRPSDFTCIFPTQSKGKDPLCEAVILNIMIILARTGDTFRELPFSEYKQRRKTDGGYTKIEKKLFPKVIGYCSSAEKAAEFSPAWERIVEGKKEA